MSTVKSKKLQVGTDASASNNFTIYQPATPDGTLRIGVGNADSPTEVARFDNTGMISGTPTPSALSTATGSAPSYSARAWLTFNGGTGTDSIIDSGNISSITDNGTGLTTVNFATNLPNANYAVAGITTAYSNLGPNENIAFSSAGATGSQTPTTKTTSAVQLVYGHANTAAKADIAYMCLIFIG